MNYICATEVSARNEQTNHLNALHNWLIKSYGGLVNNILSVSAVFSLAVLCKCLFWINIAVYTDAFS